MTITQIKEGKSLYALYIDDEYVEMICKTAIVDYGIKTGGTIDDNRLHDLLRYSEYIRAKEKALNLLTYHDHSQKELYDKLKLKFSEYASKQAIDKLIELNLIDDRRFAERYANELITNKRLSLRGIKSKLYQKGIDKDLIDEIVEEIEINPIEQIVELLETKFSRSLDNEKGIKRVNNSLLRMGYSYSDIKSAFNKYNEYISETFGDDFYEL